MESGRDASWKVMHIFKKFKWCGNWWNQLKIKYEKKEWQINLKFSSWITVLGMKKNVFLDMKLKRNYKSNFSIWKEVKLKEITLLERKTLWHLIFQGKQVRSVKALIYYFFKVSWIKLDSIWCIKTQFSLFTFIIRNWIYFI